MTEKKYPLEMRKNLIADGFVIPKGVSAPHRKNTGSLRQDLVDDMLKKFGF